jgi:hypothetical protein
MQQNSNISDMKTLAFCINKLVLDGYTVDYKVSEDGKKLLSLTDEKLYNPEQVSIVNFYRFEGASDPADNSILYVIETDDGGKGTLTDAYGPYADPNVSKFIDHIQEISKKPVHVHP